MTSSLLLLGLEEKPGYRLGSKLCPPPPPPTQSLAWLLLQVSLALGLRSPSFISPHRSHRLAWAGANPSAAQTQLPPGPGDAPPQPRATILQPPETPASGITHTSVWERGQGDGLVKGAEPSSLGTSSRVSQGEAAWVLATPPLREHQADLHARACLWRAG